MRGVVVAVLVVVLGVLALWAVQRRLIYFPSQVVPAPPVGVEAVELTTGDGLRLDAWFVAADAPRGTVIVLNGNAGNRSGRLPLGRTLAAAGYSTLLVDYRGYGGNPGSPTEEGLALDARAALDHLLVRSDVDPDRIAYFGESLGAGVAIGLASERPPAALVLRSPFSSLAGVAGVHYPFVPSVLVRDRYANVDVVGGVDAPVLVIAGSVDSIVPLEQSRAVYEAATGPKRFVEVEGAGHNDAVFLTGDAMVAPVVAFLSETLDGG